MRCKFSFLRSFFQKGKVSVNIHPVKLLVTGAFIFLTFLSVQCNKKKPSNNVSDGVELKKYASLNDTMKYVGMNTCRKCHEDIYSTYIHTGMGSSFDKASHNKSSAQFDHPLIYDRFKDFYYMAQWNSDSLIFSEFRMQGKDTVHKRTETVQYIVGSGQHTNSHIISTQGYLNQAPMTFYTQKGTWDLPPGFEQGGNSRFGRMIGLECMTCHNGYPEFVKGSENKYSLVKNGIDCERCHGPGEKHVQDKMAGRLVDINKEIDYSIVNPAKLPIALQLDICQRCHIQGNAVLMEEKSFFDFRPGMHLSDVMNVFMPLYKGRTDEHIMASHVERMKMSPCFKESIKAAAMNKQDALRPYKNAMTCVTCHNPHVSVRSAGKNIFNNACKSCHNEVKHNECTEKTAVLVKAQYNCVKCHMPSSGTTDIPHVSVTDHFIRKPVKKNEIDKMKEFIGIACINNDQPPPEAIGNAFIAYHERFNFDISLLDSALRYFDENPAKDIQKNFRALVHIYFLKRDYPKIINYAVLSKDPLSFLNKKSFSNEDAWTCYRLGEAYKNSGQLEKALAYYTRSITLAPYKLDFQNVYGTALMEAGESEKAKKVFEFIISEYPKFHQAYSNLGYIYLSTKGDTATANRLYNKSIALNPDYLQAWLNKAGLYIYKKDYKNAKQTLRYILKKNPSDRQAKAILNTLESI